MSKIIKVSTDLEVTVHDFPQGTIREQNRQLCELIGNGCEMIEHVMPRRGGSRMIGVSEGKDMEARAFLELAGIDSGKYRIWHHNSIYVHAINEETKESVIVEKATLEVVKSPGALAGDPGLEK